MQTSMNYFEGIIRRIEFGYFVTTLFIHNGDDKKTVMLFNVTEAKKADLIKLRDNKIVYKTLLN